MCVSPFVGSLTLGPTANFKTALGSLSAIATFADGYSDDFGDKAFHCQAHARMFAGQRRQRTSEATDDVSAVSLDSSRGAQLLIHHLARHRHARCEVPGRSLSARQFVSEFSASLPEHRLELIWRQPGGENIDELSQQRDVRRRQKLFDVGCEFEDM
jgi:hypothetical protein